MSKSNTFENDIQALFFNIVTINQLAENDTTSPATNIYVSLHTSDPGEAGSQNTNETAYGAYARQAVSRTTTGWKVTGNTVYPRANIAFPTPTSGTGGTITHFGVGVSLSGATKLMYSGTVTPNITVSSSSAPTLTTGTNITED